MAEIGWSNDTYFFDITSEDVSGGDKNVTRIINEDVINFSITEEMTKVSTGTITVNDNHNYYSRIFRNGMRLKISFGYKMRKIFQTLLNDSARSNISGVIQSPSGGGDSSGLSTFNITFYSNDILQQKTIKVYDNDTRYTVIQKLFLDLGIATPVIDFEASTIICDKKNPVRQWETSFALLNRLAKEWNCLFSVGYTQSGVKSGMFIDPAKVKTSGVLYNKSLVFNASAKELYYNSLDKSNVKSYSWQQHIGESGQGDNVSIRIGINGKPIFERRVAEGQKVVTYQLDPSKIEAKYASVKDPQAKTQLFQQFVNATDFEQVKWAFKPVETPTAPQGQGFTITVDMIGDPIVLPGQEVVFKGGFPSILTQSQSGTNELTYYILKATHNINKQEYTTSIEIVDAYTLNGSYLQNTRELP